LRKLDLQMPLLRRTLTTFLPTTGKKYSHVRIGRRRDEGTVPRFSASRTGARTRSCSGRSAAARRRAPTWLEEPLSIEETAEKYVRPALRRVFVDLCRKPVGHYLDRFDSAATCAQGHVRRDDAFSGLNGDW